MAKSYILSREDLKNIIVGSKSFIGHKCREMIRQGKDPSKLTYRQTDAMIDEFIDSIKEIKMEDVLDQVDEVLEKTTGINTRELLNRKKNES